VCVRERACARDRQRTREREIERGREERERDRGRERERERARARERQTDRQRERGKRLYIDDAPCFACIHVVQRMLQLEHGNIPLITNTSRHPHDPHIHTDTQTSRHIDTQAHWQHVYIHTTYKTTYKILQEARCVSPRFLNKRNRLSFFKKQLTFLQFYSNDLRSMETGGKRRHHRRDKVESEGLLDIPHICKH